MSLNTDDRVSSQKPHLFIAGGGSGGHVFPGLAVAEEMAARGWRVSWVGRPEGMERQLVTSRGLPYRGLAARPLVGHGVGARLAAIATLARSALAARRLIRSEQCRAVLGTGGYVSAPSVVGARLAGRPAVLLEPNAVPGAANRLLSRFADAAAVAWQESGQRLTCSVRVTGVPIRRGFAGMEEIAPGERRRVLVLGGSQGALELNRIVPQALARLAGGGMALAVRHQTGAAHLESARETWATLGQSGLDLELVPFVDDVAAALGEADLVISRAGAITLAEISASGRPALLIPYGFAGGHQADNAARLEAGGGARVLRPEETDVAGCAAALTDLLADPESLRLMGRALRELARPTAASSVAELLEEVAV
jgi:UDP-N-acetylglucosamine--N-acetylmuramyl-(pentapeptide) pyrophosphoryl-undecaprenol N-acetylglucosamine transferase